MNALRTPRPDNPRLMCTSIADCWIHDKQYRINIEEWFDHKPTTLEDAKSMDATAARKKQMLEATGPKTMRGQDRNIAFQGLGQIRSTDAGRGTYGGAGGGSNTTQLRGTSEQRHALNIVRSDRGKGKDVQDDKGKGQEKGEGKGPPKGTGQDKRKGKPYYAQHAGRHYPYSRDWW